MAGGIGFQRATVPDSNDKQREIGIWYPSDAPASSQPLGPYQQTVALLQQQNSELRSVMAARNVALGQQQAVDRTLPVPALAERAARKFARDEHVRIFCGDSRVVMPEVLALLTGPALFWLDAGYYGWVGMRTDERRLSAELEMIMSLMWWKQTTVTLPRATPILRRS